MVLMEWEKREVRFGRKILEWYDGMGFDRILIGNG